MIVIVTKKLAEQLSLTDTLLRDHQGRKLNDRAHFAPLSGRLEQLTLALLAAPGFMPITADVSATATFDHSPNTELNREVDGVVDYLRTTVRPIMQAGDQLSQYESAKADEAFKYLNYLYHLVCAAIENQARKELHAIYDVHGAARLIQTATLLAEIRDGLTMPVGAVTD